MGQYGRIGKRRSGSGTWQWMVLGFFPGILCGGVLVFGLFASGALNSLTTASLPTPTPITIIATNPPTNTSVPTVVVATEIPTQGTTPTSEVVGTADMSQMQIATSVPPTALGLVTTPQSGVTPLAASTSISSAPNSQATLATLESGVAGPTISGVDVAAPTILPELAALQQIRSATSNIPGGTFTMGTTPQEVLQAVDECVGRDEGNCQESFGEDSVPQFQVQLEAYQMEKTEVTFAQYLAFLTYLKRLGKTHKDACPSPNGASNLCIQTSNEVPGNDQEGSSAPFTFTAANYNVNAALLPYPVYGVTWAGAQAYCEAIGRRLPTEAEWEFAAKGNDPGRIYPWGNIWVETNAKTSRPRLPAGMVAVGTYQTGATTNGLLDMAGNVEEWVSDYYGADYYTQMSNQPQPVKDPQGPENGIQKVLRGGSWDTLPFFARTVHRRSEFPAPDGNGTTFPRTIGFRCAADADADVPVSDGNVDASTLGAEIPTATVPAAEGAPQVEGSKNS